LPTRGNTHRYKRAPKWRGGWEEGGIEADRIVSATQRERIHAGGPVRRVAVYCELKGRWRVADDAARNPARAATCAAAPGLRLRGQIRSSAEFSFLREEAGGRRCGRPADVFPDGAAERIPRRDGGGGFLAGPVIRDRFPDGEGP